MQMHNLILNSIFSMCMYFYDVETVCCRISVEKGILEIYCSIKDDNITKNIEDYEYK